MKQLWLFTGMALVLTAFLALPAEAQKGKGGGKGGGNGKGGGHGESRSDSSPAEPKRLPVGEKTPSTPSPDDARRLPVGDKTLSSTPDRSPARAFDHPKSGNSLPQEV